MEEELKRKMEQAIWSAKSLFERRKAAGSAANISFSHRDRIYISASGVCFGDLSMGSFAVMDREGGHLGGPKPSKEFPLHRLLYIRKGVGAVLHTHSFYAVLWSCLRHENMHDVIPAHTPYLRMKVGKVGMVPYAPPGSDELFALFEKYNIDSIGKPIYGLSVKFVDENGSVVDRNLKGRFCFSGENVMLCYYNDEAETLAVKYIDDDGIEWFHTDTYGHMDEKNWIYFDGRERRFFITYDSSGSPYKVYCDHVQSVIKRHNSVSDCVVVKQPNGKRYFVPIAFVVASSEQWGTVKNEILELCKKELQGCAVPCEFILIDEIPVSNAGKVDYRALERIAEEEENEPAK